MHELKRLPWGLKKGKIVKKKKKVQTIPHYPFTYKNSVRGAWSTGQILSVGALPEVVMERGQKSKSKE